MFKVDFTYQDIQESCNQIASFAKTNDVELIVGIMRGGAIPAVMISHLASLPIEIVRYSSLAGVGDGRNYDNVIPDSIANETRKILFIDDICDSGNTLKEIKIAMKAAGNTSALYGAVVYRDHTKSQFTPDICVHVVQTTEWINFPWEQKL